MRKGMRWKRWLLGALAAILLLAVAAGIFAHTALRRSLPLLDGERTLAGLSAPARLERDALGVVTVRAENRLDLARATGFAHGQDRFFAMDLQRRAGTGELAALLGGHALEFDKTRRLHGGPSLVEEAFSRLETVERELLEAYAAGVNAGLASLRARPPEYFALRQRPEPWRARDTLAVGLAMYYTLQDAFGFQQQQREALRKHFPAEVVAFLLEAPGFAEAPLDGAVPPRLPFPAAEWASALRNFTETIDLADLGSVFAEDVHPGSNAWAAGPARTSSGRAILAGDPHLGLGLPIIWFRMAMHYTTSDGKPISLHGATIPGAPFLVGGSNTRVAWSLTNSYARLTDLVELRLDPENPSRYHDGVGYRPFGKRVETIRVRGTKKPVTREVKTSVWGPVWPQSTRVESGTEEPERPRPLFAIRWMGASKHGLSAGLHRLEEADSLEALFLAADTSGIPTQNLIAVDSAGNIGWSLLGAIPKRSDGGANPFALSPAEATAVWEHPLPRDQHPRIENPPQGALWSANHRKLQGAAGSSLGDGGYARDGRAARVRDRLLASEKHDEASFREIQLDANAAFFEEYREFLIRIIDAADENGAPVEPSLAKMRAVLRAWDGGANADSIGFRVLHRWYDRFRSTVGRHLFAPIIAEVPAARARIRLPGTHAAFREVIHAAPESLLPPGESDWTTLHLQILRNIAGELMDDGGNWRDATWGAHNRLRAAHPFSILVPILSRWIDMPAEPMSGSPFSPRVQWRAFGQSYRMVVSPGNEENASFTMPGGNSGHPLSPFYRAGHKEWARGEPLPLLPGPAKHTLRLLPDSASSPIITGIPTDSACFGTHHPQGSAARCKRLSDWH